MDLSPYGFWITIIIGGAIIAAFSAYQQYTSDEFRVKPVIRDFVIGAFLAAVAYMFVPETIQEWLNTSQSTMSNMMPSGSAEIELQTGPARF
jgi:putative effector of murein hydrolase